MVAKIKRAESNMALLYGAEIVASSKMLDLANGAGELEDHVANTAQSAANLASNLAAGADSLVSMNYSYLKQASMTNQTGQVVPAMGSERDWATRGDTGANASADAGRLYGYVTKPGVFQSGGFYNEWGKATNVGEPEAAEKVDSLTQSIDSLNQFN